MAHECNICGGDLAPAGPNGFLSCLECTARPVTRVLWMTLEAQGVLVPGKRVLHIAPERALAPRLRAIFGDGYEPVDIDPSLYPYAEGITALDLCRDAATLPTAHYDLIIHSHVLEHVRCNVTAVLLHLHRALRPDGVQICCIPFSRNRHSSEDLGPLDAAEADRRFGQHDHVRVFGALDVHETIGMIFRLPLEYGLYRAFGAEALERHGIPEVARTGWTPHTILTLAKQDLLIGT